jgi:NAD(P)-dependent dehydrogenase (short-subunit alcohol dehydrogenase family)
MTAVPAAPTTTSAALAAQHVVVIGGSSGIGRAVAEHALAAGATVTVASRTPTEVAVAGATARPETVDLTDTASVEALFERVGGFDHLVVSAGPGAMGTVRDLTSEQARPYLDTKFWGYYEAVRAAAATIAPTGSITLVGGGASRKHAPGRPVMAAVNAALEAFGKANALDLAPVRVNVVAPGLVDTPAYDAVPEEVRRGMYAGYAAAVPAGRVGTTADVASAVLFLATSPWVTGTVLDVDGGVHVS